MIVTPNSFRRRPDFLRILVVALSLTANGVRAETVTNLEAVDANGVSTWGRSFPLTITGVLLTDPEEMLDATPDFIPWSNGAGAYQMGGQWQMFVQAVATNDRGGVECWMGQNYGNLPWIHNSEFSYSNEAWAAEVWRVSHDPLTGHAFRKGDLVVVTANGSLFYGGMQNINEEHNIDPALDFTISLVTSNYGLPAPEVISLMSVMRTNGGTAAHYDIFDQTRATGGEHWQGLRVRINSLMLVSTNGWSTNTNWSARKFAVTDGEGRNFTLIHPRVELGPPPTNRFDAIGVFLQESGSGTDGTFGYELFVQEIEPSATAALDIQRQGDSVVLRWPGSLANWQLQSIDSLSTTNWTAVTNSPALIDGQNAVIWEMTTPQKFFRLKRLQ
jgi:hypothetical protein